MGVLPSTQPVATLAYHTSLLPRERARQGPPATPALPDVHGACLTNCAPCVPRAEFEMSLWQRTHGSGLRQLRGRWGSLVSFAYHTMGIAAVDTTARGVPSSRGTSKSLFLALRTVCARLRACCTGRRPKALH